MSHRIESTDRQEGREQAWHDLTVIREDLDLDHNWLTEWEIVHRPMYILMPSGVYERTDYTHLIGSDNGQALGVPFADSFRPLSNKEFLDLLRDSVGGTRHRLESMGTIRSRGRRFASFKINGLDDFKAAGREFKTYLNFGDGLDKSSDLWSNTSSICTVCDNTFSMNLVSVERDGGLSRTRHTKNIVARLPKIADLIDKAVGVQAEFAAAMDALAKKPVAPELARRVYAGFIAPNAATELSARSSNTVDHLVDLFKGGAGNRGENRADLFSAATDYYTHESSGKNVRDPQRQFTSSEFGTGANAKREFWNIVRDDERLSKVADRGEELILATKD